MPRYFTLYLTLLAMLAFAGNSLLCRLALREGAIDAAGFTAIRLVSGALMLWLLLQLRRGNRAAPQGDWTSASALLLYAAAFSYAYITLDAATGALLLFGAVQLSMIGFGLWHGERLSGRQLVGLSMALVGLLVLLLPGLSAPPLGGAVLMVAAGIAWGVYSLRGRGTQDPLAVTAGNFLRTVPAVLLLPALSPSHTIPAAEGILYAALSGALASGAGYAIWYAALRNLNATTAATVQLSVPVLAAAGGVLLLGEAITLRLLLASAAILGGIALFIATRR